MNALKKRQLSIAVAAALSTTLISGVAFSQEADETVEEVLVTG